MHLGNTGAAAVWELNLRVGGAPARVQRGCKSVGTAATELTRIYSSWSGFRNVWPCPSLCLAPSLLGSEHSSGANSCLAPGNRDRSPAWSGGKPLMRLTLVCFPRPCTCMFICSSPVPPVAVASFHNTLPVARGPSWDIAVCREGDETGGLRASESLGSRTPAVAAVECSLHPLLAPNDPSQLPS